ncbi:MAG: two-component system LytT family sensor kinase [Saprospiraceae bacterium]|jgi:two-component system LytT family sensor kinase
MKRIGLQSSVISIFFLWMFLVKLELLGMKGAFIHTLLNLGMLIILYNAHGKLLVNTFFESKKYLRFVIGSVILIAIYLIIRFNVINPLLESVYPQNNRLSIGKMRYLIGFLSILIVTFSTLVHLLENRFKKERANQLLIQEHQAAQLQFLKAQINPHFLFNTLNNIYSLSIAQSTKTPQMILQLSQLLRYVIYESQNKKVSLSGELEQIEKYIALFQLKHEKPVDIKLEKEGIINGQSTEPMMLIPLVENALKHCDFDANEKAFSRIQVKMDGYLLNFYTINYKNDHNQQKDEVGGVGLKNIRKRLALNSPGQHELVINDLEDTFEVILQIKVS